jgi:hypothetical protein
MVCYVLSICVSVLTLDAAVTLSSTISSDRTPTGCDPSLASILLTDNTQKRPHPAAFQSDSQSTSSKWTRFLSPSPLLCEDNPTSFASSSCSTLDDLRSNDNVLLPTSPCSPPGEPDNLADPLRDLDVAEVDAVMILSQLGARC